MSHFDLIANGLDVAPIIRQLDMRPGLWNWYHNRRSGDSPHRETSDIWVRYRDNSDLHGPEDFRGPHLSTFYQAWQFLPAMHDLVYDLSARVRSVHMGGILITRIPPGCQVYPHHDRGTWHAEYHNCKIYVPLRADVGCINFCGEGETEEAQYMRPGEAWRFDNLVTHSVFNGSLADRITLILCFRTEP